MYQKSLEKSDVGPEGFYFQNVYEAKISSFLLFSKIIQTGKPSVPFRFSTQKKLKANENRTSLVSFSKVQDLWSSKVETDVILKSVYIKCVCVTIFLRYEHVNQTITG